VKVDFFAVSTARNNSKKSIEQVEYASK